MAVILDQKNPTSPVQDNTSLHRFELKVGDAVAFANYRLTANSVVITHTETPPALRGQGIAAQLVEGALELIQSRNLKVVGGCSFVVDYLEKHPEWRGLEL
jgi:predicted GNAT family acetyltransferase